MGNSQNERINMELLKKLEHWFLLNCDGDWEHSYGITIDTLDNPGWKLVVDLTDTLLEDVAFHSVQVGDSTDKKNFWINCYKENNVFIGMGSTDSLKKILSIFLEWADCNSDTSTWDATVTNLIKQCKVCNDVEQLRQLYKDIELIPQEHPRKRELVDLFDAKWNAIINFIP